VPLASWFHVFLARNHLKLVSRFTLCCCCQLNPPIPSPSCRILSAVAISMLGFHLFLVFGGSLICICVPFTCGGAGAAIFWGVLTFQRHFDFSKAFGAVLGSFGNDWNCVLFLRHFCLKEKKCLKLS
jgi:hypothetical protein